MTRQSNTSPTDDSHPWKACQPGELHSAVVGMRRRRQQQRIRKSASVVSVVVLAVATSAWLIPGMPQHFLEGAYACQDVADRAEDYVAGKLNGLTNRKIETHLTTCQECREHIESLKLKRDAQATPDPNTHVQPIESHRLTDFGVSPPQHDLFDPQRLLVSR